MPAFTHVVKTPPRFRMAPRLRRARWGWALAGWLLAGAAAAENPKTQPVDWRDQVLYFAIIDRFADGDPTNNDQNAGVFDPADGSKNSGGDLRGITKRLDYIEGLGVTGLWITPPVANQWWDDEARFSGYHGYWSSDFSAVDAHYGTLDDYVALGRARVAGRVNSGNTLLPGLFGALMGQTGPSNRVPSGFLTK